MVYAFTLVDADDQTQFGLVTSDNVEEALDYIEDAFPDSTEVWVSEQVEDFINSQYSGIALLTTV